MPGESQPRDTAPPTDPLAPSVLAACYPYGFLNMHNFSGNWLHGQMRSTGEVGFQMVSNPSRANSAALTSLAAGAAVAFFLNAMRLRFWWWPFHPIGYLAADAWGTQWWYMPFLLGWLAKSLVVRYGGPHLYRRTIPVAAGAIIGDLPVDSLWPVAEWLASAYM